MRGDSVYRTYDLAVLDVFYLTLGVWAWGLGYPNRRLPARMLSLQNPE
jgi:hypothetical protein